MLNYEYPPLGGGASPITKALAEHLAAGHDVDVVTMGYRGLPRVERQGRLRVFRVPARRSSQVGASTGEMASYLASALPWCMLLIRHFRYDLIHTHFIFPTGVLAVALKRIFGIPVVVTIHGSDVPGYNPDRFNQSHRLLAPLWRSVATSVDAIISPSLYLRDLLQAQCPVPVQIIPNGFTPLHQPSVTKKSQILFVGRLFPRKGAQFLLSALAEIDLQGWECVVAGDGPMMQELRNQAQDLGLPVKFPGFVKGAALEELYSTSAIFVMPSLAENFPVVLLEALSAGCSVITTNTTGMPEVVGDAGLLTPPGDVLALRAAIQRLMNDEDLRHRLGDAAHRQVAMFNWNGVLSQHEAVYMQIVKTDR